MASNAPRESRQEQTLPLVIVGYQAAKKVFFEELRLDKAKESLWDEHRMKERTVIAYVDGFTNMMRGTKYTQTLGITAIRYYLEQFAQHYGPSAVRSAVASIRAHLVYAKEKMGNKNEPIIALVNQYAEQFHVAITEEAQEAEAKSDLERARMLSSRERLALLSVKPHQPEMRMSKPRLEPVRSQLVIAEVLSRANGKCGRCNNDAPFLRRGSTEPYLEVHHKNRLADGGDDTVANAIALCPNCHREEHFGPLRRHQ